MKLALFHVEHTTEIQGAPGVAVRCGYHRLFGKQGAASEEFPQIIHMEPGAISAEVDTGFRVPSATSVDIREPERRSLLAPGDHSNEPPGRTGSRYL